MKRPLASCALLFGLTSAAQQPDGLPNTHALNAMAQELRAPAPQASLGDRAQLWDQFTGAWDCEYTFFSEDGQTRHRSGELFFGWILDGQAVQDIWITDPKAAGTERDIATSVRFFDRKTNLWRVISVSPAHGSLMSVQGGPEGDRIVLRGVDDRGSPVRWSFNGITTNSFVWQGEVSRDGGKTWRLQEEHHMRRRMGFDRHKSSTILMQTLSSTQPHPSLGDAAKLFGRFVGPWDLDCTLYKSDGTVDGRFKGAWIFGWALDGRLMQDVIVEGQGKAAKKRGTTIRLFEPQSRQWQIVWIPPWSGDVLILKGGAGGHGIVLTGQDADGSQIRWSFNNIQENSFHWHGETSADGGKTWRTEQEMTVTRSRQT